MSGISFDDISLPEGDAQKPAEGISPTTATDGNQLPPNEAASIEENKEASTTDDTAVSTQEDESKQPDKAEDKATQSQEFEPVGQDSKTTESQPELTEFHKHPDWIKMQEKLHAAEIEAAEFRGRLQAQEQSTKQEEIKPTVPMDKTPVELAEMALRNKVASGWEPKDQLEVTLELRKLEGQAQKAQDDYNQKVAAAKAKETQEREAALAKEVDTTMDGWGLSDEDKQTVAGYAAKLVSDGIINKAAGPKKILEYAHEQVKLQGLLKSQSATDDSPKRITNNGEKKAKETTNVTKPVSNGDGNKSERGKVDLRKSLDEIVMEEAAKLG